MSDAPAAQLPIAELRPRPVRSWLWLLPIVVACAAIALAAHAWTERGVEVSVRLADGHGLKAGDRVRFRGIDVGEVDDLALASDFNGVVARVRLHPTARACARSGTLFWVVRPQVGFGGVAGLETIAGPHYLEVLPGSGDEQRAFIGLDEPPVADVLGSGGVDIVLQADRCGGLRPGAPVLYRQMAVGAVVSVGLASDGSAVEARARIRDAYAPLVRARSRFWEAGGFTLDAGITGIELRFESLEALAGGGVAFATPPDGGDAAVDGARFHVQDKPDKSWLEWKPAIALARTALPAEPPRPQMAATSWTRGGWWSSTERRRGWVLPTESGLLGPAELVAPPSGARAGSAHVEINGTRFELAKPPTWSIAGIAGAELTIPGDPPWPRARLRMAAAPEDVLLVGDPARPPLTVAAARLAGDVRGWTVDPSLAFSADSHGSLAVATRDGAVVGVLLVEDGRGRIAPIPPEAVADAH